MKIRTQLVLAFSAVIVIVLMLSGGNYWSLRNLVKTANWVKHTHQVLADAHAIEKLAVDMGYGVRGFVITGKETYLEPYTKAKEAYAVSLAGLKKLVSDNPAQIARLTAIDALMQEWDKIVAGAQIAARRKLGADGNLAGVAGMVFKGTGKAYMDRMRGMWDEFQATEDALLKVRNKEAAATVAKSIWLAVFGIAIGVLISVVAMIVVVRTVFRQVGGEPGPIALIAERMATGDLAVDWRRGITTPTGILAAVGRMADDFRSQIKEIKEAANVLASSASEISASVAQVTSGALESATAVTETTATVEEVKQGAHLTSEKSKAVAENAQKGLQMAHTGRKATETVSEGMVRINEQMTSIADTIVKLGEQSQAIGEITSTVDDIAEQSNLLAVNAAVEAAKAGEHGKGFAVVAQEIKTLAEQSKQATKQVRGILAEIQKATGAAVMATEQGSKAVEQGSKESLSANEAIQALSATFTEAVQSSRQIAASAQEQLTGMDQVAQAMESIKEASQENVTSMKQLENAAHSLKDIGHKFTELIARYKV